MDALGIPSDAFIMLSIGRLVPRKGIAWFVEKVLPSLPQMAHYIVAGEGPELARIAKAIDHRRLHHRVHCLGLVKEDLRDTFLYGADLLLSPNVPIPGDMEGFGLINIEAALRATPVVASNLEGIKDAVIPEVTGFLLRPLDADGWIDFLQSLMNNRQSLATRGMRFQAAATQHFGVQRMRQELMSALHALDC